LGALLKTGGDHAEVTGLALVEDPSHAILIELADPHLYLLGSAQLLSHNPVGKP
jgi:hypothetical protein